MTYKNLISIAFMCAYATGARADWVTVECSFETECYETDACDGAGFSVRLSAGDGAGDVIMRTAAETISGQAGGSDATALTWIAQTDSAAHLLSWGADGPARYSVHLLLGPEVVTYLGACEVAQ